jgi:hypothetical protein
MERRKFLASSLSASALAITYAGGDLKAARGTVAARDREFYQVRRYHINSGPQRKLCDDYFRDALIPALNRLTISPVGVFDLRIGPNTPTIFVLIPGTFAEMIATLENRLYQDGDYTKAGAAFLTAPAKEPAFDRIDSTLLQAFEKWPNLVLPKATATQGARVFELRTYEQATDQDHRRKVEMMQSGETDIFAKYGFEMIFFSETLIGSRLPSLTYMLCFESMAARDKQWAAFTTSDDWKAYSTQPKYAFEPIVSNISNLILTPTIYSQI